MKCQCNEKMIRGFWQKKISPALCAYVLLPDSKTTYSVCKKAFNVNQNNNE